jgi:hypothetical protein
MTAKNVKIVELYHKWLRLWSSQPTKHPIFFGDFPAFLGKDSMQDFSWWSLVRSLLSANLDGYLSVLRMITMPIESLSTGAKPRSQNLVRRTSFAEEIQSGPETENLVWSRSNTEQLE